MALPSVEITDLMHGTIAVISAVATSFDTLTIETEVILRALTVIEASVVVGIFADPIDTDLTLGALDDFSVAIAARRVVDALVANAALTVAAVKVLVAFGFGYNPSE